MSETGVARKTTNRPFWVTAAVVYVLAISLAAAWIWCAEHAQAKAATPTTVVMVAARDIHRNALVRDDDIVATGGGAAPAMAKTLSGQYAKREIPSGEPVTSSLVQSAPYLQSEPGELWLGFPTLRAQVDSGDVNGGQRALLCPISGQGQPVVVDAVVCPAAKAGGCTAFLHFDVRASADAARLLRNGDSVAKTCAGPGANG